MCRHWMKAVGGPNDPGPEPEVPGCARRQKCLELDEVSVRSCRCLAGHHVVNGRVAPFPRGVKLLQVAVPFQQPRAERASGCRAIADVTICLLGPTRLVPDVPGHQCWMCRVTFPHGREEVCHCIHRLSVVAADAGRQSHIAVTAKRGNDSMAHRIDHSALRQFAMDPERLNIRDGGQHHAKPFRVSCVHQPVIIFEAKHSRFWFDPSPAAPELYYLKARLTDACEVSRPITLLGKRWSVVLRPYERGNKFHACPP